MQGNWSATDVCKGREEQSASLGLHARLRTTGTRTFCSYLLFSRIVY